MKACWRIDVDGLDAPGGGVWRSGDTPAEALGDLVAELMRRRDAQEAEAQRISEALEATYDARAHI